MTRITFDEAEHEELTRILKAIESQTKAAMERGGATELYHLARDAVKRIEKGERFKIHAGALIGLGAVSMTIGAAIGRHQQRLDEERGTVTDYPAHR